MNLTDCGQSTNFGFRVAGILLKNNKILLQSDNLIDFWTLPGGSVKLFESSEEALKREFLEEMDIEIEIVRFLWVVENTFAFDNIKSHGIGFDFIVKPVEWQNKLDLDEFSGIEKDFAIEGTRYENVKNLKLKFRWFDLSELDSITIKPKIYHQALKNIPKYPIILRNLEI